MCNCAQALWDWVILFLVIYTAIFTPYVAVSIVFGVKIAWYDNIMRMWSRLVFEMHSKKN